MVTGLIILVESSRLKEKFNIGARDGFTFFFAFIKSVCLLWDKTHLCSIFIKAHNMKLQHKVTTTITGLKT